MSLRIGFVGVGTMGRAMATNVIKAGYELVSYDVREEPLSALGKLGARIARSPKEVAEHSEVTEIAVVDDLQVEAVLNGADGVFEGVRPGSIIAIHSTISAETVLKLAEVAQSKRVNLLEAPITGGRTGAEDRNLCYIVGGEREVLEKCREIFSTSGSHIFHTGGLGSASIVKIILQVVVCINMLAAKEAEILCENAGIDFHRFSEILHVSSGQSFVSDNWIERFKRPHDSISIRQHRAEVFKKSLSPALGLGERFGILLPGASLAHEQLDQIMGIASEDQKISGV
jgi:3-hydroxyisobutyrate dehydrogenase-like beta-hydroxyacid dehydrogenase